MRGEGKNFFFYSFLLLCSSQLFHSKKKKLLRIVNVKMVLESVTENVYVRKSIMGAQWGASWLKDQLWPIYSTGIVVGALCLLASVHEKSLLADHYYGANHVLIDQQDREVKNAAAIMEDDASKAVKQYVWGLSSAEFKQLATERGIGDRLA